MLPILVQHLPRDRERLGMRPVQMAVRHVQLADLQCPILGQGETQPADLYEPIVELCGWPR